MRRLLSYFLASYYYLRSSYKMWRARRLQADDLIYTTQGSVRIEVYPGKKTQSPCDFIVKFKEPGKRLRTPAHVHLVVEMYVKFAFNPSLTIKLRDHMLKMMSQIKPITSFPPVLQFFQKQHVAPFTQLDNVGEFPVEFLLVVTELIAIQEKTNYPQGSLLSFA